MAVGGGEKEREESIIYTKIFTFCIYLSIKFLP